MIVPPRASAYNRSLMFKQRSAATVFETDVYPRPSQLPRPNPDLSPRDVVIIQLEALQNNDLYEYDGGIRIAFAFASPGNRAFVGPVEHFIQLVKNPLYNAMIGFQRADLSTTLILGDHAQVRVELVDARGRRFRYVWSLSRQTEHPYEGCWMTDGVMLG
jgi:hypothetical protein